MVIHGRAAKWYDGVSDPPASLGRNGDYYLRSDGRVWNRQSGSWGTSLFSLKGPTGPAGTGITGGGTIFVQSGKTLTVNDDFDLTGGGSLSIAAGKTVTFLKTITLDGGDGKTFSLPNASGRICIYIDTVPTSQTQSGKKGTFASDGVFLHFAYDNDKWGYGFLSQSPYPTP